MSAAARRARLWMYAYMSGSDRVEIPAVEAEGWGRRPAPPPPLRLHCVDYVGGFVIAMNILVWALFFRGFLLYDDDSVVNGLALHLTRMYMLVMMKSTSSAPASWTAIALLPTCPAPVLSTPLVCYEWEKPAAAAISGPADNNRWIHEHDGDYMAAKKCFNSIVSDAAWTCDEQDHDYKAAVKCFDSLVRDASRICFVWSYDAIPPTHQSDDPPPT